MTHRLDHLEAAGLIVRLPDPADRRGSLVQLTDLGRDAIDRALEVHVDNLHRVFDTALAAEDRELLAGLLRALLTSLESAESVTARSPGDGRSVDSTAR